MRMLRTLFLEPLPWAILIALIAFGVFMCCGAYTATFRELFDPSPMLAEVLKIRAMRLACAFVVGGSLAVAGAACQAVLRNPLADPYILGISGGASLGAALAISLGLGAISELFIPGFSFCGAVAALAVVLGLSRFWTADASSSIALAGVVVGSICSSFLMFLISVSGSHELNSITWWMLGSLQPSLPLLPAAAVLLAAGTVILTLFGRDVDAITFGEETAFSLGTDPRLLSYLLLGTASMLAAGSVAMSGIIGFVGLVVPHMLRRLFGAGHIRLFPLCLTLGGVFLMACDTAARCLLPNGELPVGVVTSLIGGPFFLWLLARRRVWK